VTITTDPPQQIALDGEMFGTTPATFKVLPRRLTVVTDYHQAIAVQFDPELPVAEMKRQILQTVG
jgi:hypothetical protein